jgi:DNA-binding transcriptional regulator PaaX
MVLRVRQNSFGGQLLMYLFAAEELIIEVATFRPVPYGRAPLTKKQSENRSTLYRLVRFGFIEIIDKDDKEYFKLTKTGEMQALMLKARLSHKGKWDGKWRIVIFDIPEGTKKERDQLRRLLLENNFCKWQASVYISPHPINRQAIDYLKETGLIQYIRFARIDELDEDKDLKKRFGL